MAKEGTPTKGRPTISKAERENRALKDEVRKLKEQLRRAHLTIDIQKKLSELLESTSNLNDDDSSNSTPPKSSS